MANNRLYRKMNAQRETDFVPRLWNARGKPITKKDMADAIKKADAMISETVELEIPNIEEEVSVEDLPKDLVFLSAEEMEAL